MTARAFLTGHSRQEKEVARKCGPSLQRKSNKLGTKANIRTLTLYEDPTHGYWHIAKHCPDGKAFPDISRLVEEFAKTGKPPAVRDVRGRRPNPPAAISRKIDSSHRRRSTRKTPRTNQSIYDVPDDDDSETLCSASVLYRPQSSECEERGLDESTVGDASAVETTNTMEAANAAGEHDAMEGVDALGEVDAMGDAEMTEHDAIGVVTTVAEADKAADDSATDDSVADAELMGWDADYTTGLEDPLGWAAEDMTGMETTLIWEADNAASMEDPLAWEPEIDFEGWDACSPETTSQYSRGHTSIAAGMADQPHLSTNTRYHETQKAELSKKWAAVALAKAIALQQRYIYCLW